MTLTTPYSATFVIGDGVTKTFSYLFEEVSESFISVMVYNTLTGLTSTPTYTVDTDQKQVIFGDETLAPTSDDIVCIYRQTPTIQDTPFRTLEGYNAKALENILSKIVAMIQEIKSNYFSTQILQGDPWQLDLLKSADDGATVNIDYVAKKLVKGLYFQISNGNLQVSADGSSYITMPKSADIVEFRQVQTVLEDLTVQYRLQYRIGNEWFNAESNAEATADEAKQIAEEARDIASDAKDIAQDASDKVDGFDDRITQAEQDASDAKDIAQDASDAVSAHITDTNNPHSVTKAQIGLGNCDNTADLDKPISTATQTALDGKQTKSASDYNMGNSTGGWTAMTTGQQNALNSGATTTNIGQIATNTSNIANEIIDRQNADNGLQGQIDAIVAKSDVVDIVGTYAELQAYDTSGLGNNDVVKVISDSTHNDAPSYYRWVISGGVGSWVYIGSEAETYTKAETDTLLNAKQDVLTAGSNITISGNTISATDTTYTGSDGITLTGTNFTNSGVRSVSGGTTNGTISVNTNGTSADVAVTGLGSAAYTASTDYATAAQGSKADTAVQPGDLATVATTGDYDDLLNKPTIPTVNNATITVTQNGSSVGSFTLNQASGDTIALTDTTYSVMTGASAGDAGTSGLVPAPAAGDQAKFLQGDGTWANPTAATAWGNITGTLSDQTDLQNALNGKADTATTLSGYGITDGANTDLSNLTTTGKNVVANLPMPGTNNTNLTLGATGTTYTAPADGYFALASTFDANGYLFMYRAVGARYGTTLPYNTNQWVDSFVPVAKGDSIIIQYSGTASVQGFRFIYANGAQ